MSIGSSVWCYHKHEPEWYGNTQVTHNPWVRDDLLEKVLLTPNLKNEISKPNRIPFHNKKPPMICWYLQHEYMSNAIGKVKNMRLKSRYLVTPFITHSVKDKTTEAERRSAVTRSGRMRVRGFLGKEHGMGWFAEWDGCFVSYYFDWIIVHIFWIKNFYCT